MTELTFFSPMSFNGAAGAANGDFLRAILSVRSAYSVETVTATEVSLTATVLAGGFAGYRVVFLPATTFTATPGGNAPMTGAVSEVLIYDAAGKLVANISDLPVETAFNTITDSALFAALKPIITGSDGGDTITGYDGGSLLDGAGGGDVLRGGPGGDYLIGGPGNDTLSSGGGNDVIVAGDGIDVIDAGTGYDAVYLDEVTGFREAWLNQNALPGQLRIDNAEVIIFGEQGSRAHGSDVAELILGGDGRDEFDGAGGADTLVGYLGDDVLRGGAGADLLAGGLGADLLDGGDGLDIADYSGAFGALTIDLRDAGGQQTGDGVDTFISIEGLFGSVYGDTLAGSAVSNFINTLGGDNRVDGFEGDDIIYTGAGSDTVFGGLGADTLDDLAGSNYLRGDEGDDFIYGGSGFDDLNGNMGNDTVDGYTGNDWVVGGKDNDLLRGGQGDDLVYGNLGDDTCDGGDGADIVRGGQGNDSVNGGAGNDYVSGDLGSDTMAGGAGADIFHSFATSGLDIATDFNAAEGDRVQLDVGTTYTLRQDGSDTIIDMGGGNQMTLVGVTLSSLPAGWIFVG